MFGSAALDVVFGLIFVYLVLSLICSALNETIASILAWRADLLREGIGNLLDDREVKGLARALYEHPLVASVTRQKRRRLVKKEGPRYPSYLPRRTFALALLDAVGAAGKNDGELKQSLEKVDNEQVKKILLVLNEEAGGDVERLRDSVERWFDEGMERVSGWYRRRIQVALWVLAALVALAANADSLRIAQTLWSNDAVRDAVVERADRAAGGDIERLAENVGDVKELEIPLGWTLEQGDPRDVPRTIFDGIAKFLGLLVTAAALTFGAPFWFDVLKKVSQVRSAGQRPAPRDGDGERAS